MLSLGQSLKLNTRLIFLGPRGPLGSPSFVRSINHHRNTANLSDIVWLVHVWWCLEHVWWCLVASDACLVASDACLVGLVVSMYID